MEDSDGQGVADTPELPLEVSRVVPEIYIPYGRLQYTYMRNNCNKKIDVDIWTCKLYIKLEQTIPFVMVVYSG